MKCKCAPACKKALDDATKAWPNRKKASDGCCGDAAHATRKSDHNPNAAGYALAFDITHDPKNGPDCEELSLEVIYDPRITYVIWNSKIYKARTKQWEPYRGSNPHNKHMHVSIKPEATHDLSPWPWTPDVAERPKSLVAAAAVLKETKPTPAPTPADVVVKAEEPQKADPKDQAAVSGPKGWWVAASTFLGSAGTGIVSWANGASKEIVLGVFGAAALIGIIYFVMRFWYKSQQDKRATAAQIEREKMAHELTVLKIKSAMDQTANTVEVSH